MNNWKDRIKTHAQNNPQYSIRDLQQHLQSKTDVEEFATLIKQNKHKLLKEFSATSNDWQAFVPPALLSTVSRFGLVEELPSGLITPVSESRESVTKRFIWKSEPIEDYSEGEAFKETYIEGATSTIKWRKPGAKISETRERAMDLPLSVLQLNAELTTNEFKAREWKHFMHEMHNATSNAFDIRATLKNGETFDVRWNELFDNAFTPEDTTTYANWSDIKNARSKMLRRERDAVRPTVCLLNASTEAELGDTLGVNNAAFWGGSETFFKTGSLPNVYNLIFIVVPDALFGYFTNDITRKNDTFVPTNDVFLIGTNNGPTIMRHTREPLSTEVWRIFEGQKDAMNIWERYEYSVFRHTNIMRVRKPLPENEYGAILE